MSESPNKTAPPAGGAVLFGDSPTDCGTPAGVAHLLVEQFCSGIQIDASRSEGIVWLCRERLVEVENKVKGHTSLAWVLGILFYPIGFSRRERK